MNVKFTQNSPKSPLPTTEKTLPEDTAYNKDRINPIDILTIDKHSRLTLTKKFKKIVSH